MNQAFCEIVGRVALYLDQHPDGIDRLRAFLEDDKPGLWGVPDIMEYTGWKRTYISNLCTSGRLPHIPTKPIRFIPVAVKKALEEMQQGGGYGRRKSKLKTQRRQS